MSSKSDPERDPEKRFFDELKGKGVFIRTVDGFIVGTLVWVTHYGLGVKGAREFNLRFEPVVRGDTPSSRVRLVYKQFVKGIEQYEA